MASASPSIDVRALRPSDIGALVSWHRTADELLQWTGRRFHFPLDERQLAEHAATAGEFRHLICAVAPDTEAMLGHAELEVIPEHDLGRIHAVVVAPELRGRGIAGARAAALRVLRLVVMLRPADRSAIFVDADARLAVRPAGCSADSCGASD
jgi:ribosomal protein S18 acetylase RimI-like enzyme